MKLDCNHCGGRDSAEVITTLGADGRMRYHVECSACGARGSVGWHEKKSAVENWKGERQR
jgi:uncharacterized Zn finger protein